VRRRKGAPRGGRNLDRPNVTRFLLLFVVNVVVGGFLLSFAWVQAGLVDPWTRLNASATAGIARLMGVEAQAQATQVFYGSGSLQIVVGCNGVEAVLILVAALLAFPAPWARRVLGVVAGTVAILLVNLVRLVNLVAIARYAPAWLDLFHVYIWQVLIVLVAVALFLLWGTYVAHAGSVTAHPRSG
jgi:exosortase H (IPTLxxWG-CTERM-specific)